MKAIEEGDLKTAIEQLNRYMKRRPDDESVLRPFAEACVEIRPNFPGYLHNASFAYRRLLQSNPDDLKIRAKLAEIYMAIGDPTEAEAVAIKAHPESRSASLNLAHALAERGKFSDDETGIGARRVLEEVIEKHPDTVNAYAMRGSIAIQDADGEDLESTSEPGSDGIERASVRMALTWFDRAIERNPQSALALVMRSRFLRGQFTTDRDSPLLRRAQDDLKRASEIGSEEVGDLLMLVGEWIEWGDYEQAEGIHERCEQLVAIEPDEIQKQDHLLALYRSKGALELRRGNASTADRVAEQAREALGPNWPVFIISGMDERRQPGGMDLYIASGNIVAARECLEELRQFDFALQSVTQYEAMLLLIEGKPLNAIKILEEITALAPRNHRAKHLLGQTYLALSKPRQAKLPFEEIVKDLPDYYTGHFDLGRAYFAMGEWDDAYRAFQRAANIQPGFSEPWIKSLESRLNAVSEQRSGRASALERLAEEAENLPRQWADLPEIRILRSRIASSRGLRDEAMKLLASTADSLTPEAAMRLTAIHMERGDFTQAIEIARQSLNERSDRSEEWIHLARVYAAIAKSYRSDNRVDDADDYIARAHSLLKDACAKLKGNHRILVLYELASLLHRNGDLETAKESADSAAEAVRQSRSAGSSEEVIGDDFIIRLMLLRTAIARDQTNSEAVRTLIDDLKKTEGEDGHLWRLEEALWLFSQWDGQNEDDVKRMKDLLLSCIESDQGWPRPAEVLGRLYERLERPSDALEAYQRLIDHNPRGTRVAVRLVGLLERKGMFAEIEQLVEALPGDNEAFEQYRLRSALRTGNIAEVKERLQEKLRDDEEGADIPTRLLLASALMTSRQVDEARRLIEEAAKIDPLDLSVLRSRITLSSLTGNLAEAVDFCNRRVEASEDFGAFLMRGMLHEQLGWGPFNAPSDKQVHKEAARSDFERLTTIANLEQHGWLTCGNFLYRVDSPAAAVNSWDQGVKTVDRKLATAGSDHDLLKRQKNELLRFQAGVLLAAQGNDETTRNLHNRAKRILELLLAEERDHRVLVMEARRILTFENTSQEIRDKARDLLKEAIQLKPDDVDAHVAMIQLQMDRGARAAAMETLQRALEMSPRSIQLLTLRVDLLLNSATDPLQAAAAAREALQQAPPTDALRLRLAQAFAKADRFDFIYEVLDDLIAKRVGSDGTVRSGSVTTPAQQLATAVQMNQLVDVLLPRNPNLALKAAETSAKLHPNIEAVHLKLADVLNAAGDLDGARSALVAYLATDSPLRIAAISMVAQIDIAQGRLEDGKRRIKEVEALAEPTDPRLTRLRIVVLSTEKKFDELAEFAKTRLAESPHDIQTALLAFDILGASGRIMKYLPVMEDFLATVLKTRPNSIEAAYRLGDVKFVQRDFPAAETYYRRVIEWNPNHIKALNAIAWLLCEHRRQYQEALRFADRAVGLKLHGAATLDTRGVIHHRLAESLSPGSQEARTHIEQAQKDLEESIRIATDSGNRATRATASYHLAAVRFFSGDIDGARTLAEEAKTLIDQGGSVMSDQDLASLDELIKKLSMKAAG
jgi:tetratricopeptide (TPR) repeat protein